jgi:hypothetical protein
MRMQSKKLTKGMSLFTVLSIALTAIFAVVSPVLDLDCGADPGHVANGMRDAPDSSVTEASDTASNPCDQSTKPVQPDGSGHQEGQRLHVHGMDNHALSGTLVATRVFEESSSPVPFLLLQLSDTKVQPPTEPPRTIA